MKPGKSGDAWAGHDILKKKNCGDSGSVDQQENGIKRT